MSADVTPPRVWWCGGNLIVARRYGSCFDELEVTATGVEEVAELSVVPADAVELRAVPPGREDMCSQVGCGLDRGSVVNELSRLLRGMARRVGELREFGVTVEGREEMARVKEEARGLRLTVAAQVRQLGVLETVRLSSGRLIEDLRRQVSPTHIPGVDMADLAALLYSAAQAADEQSYLSCAESLRDVARSVEQRPDLAAAVAAALSGEAQTP